MQREFENRSMVKNRRRDLQMLNRSVSLFTKPWVALLVQGSFLRNLFPWQSLKYWPYGWEELGGGLEVSWPSWSVIAHANIKVKISSKWNDHFVLNSKGMPWYRITNLLKYKKTLDTQNHTLKLSFRILASMIEECLPIIIVRKSMSTDEICDIL